MYLGTGIPRVCVRGDTACVVWPGTPVWPMFAMKRIERQRGELTDAGTPRGINSGDRRLLLTPAFIIRIKTLGLRPPDGPYTWNQPLRCDDDGQRPTWRDGT